MDDLFKKFVQYKRTQNEVAFDRVEKDQILYLDKDEIIEEGIFKFRNLKKSGFCTFYCGLSFWNIKSEYFTESRKASRRIKNFSRVYIIKNASDLNNEYLVLQMIEDAKNGTQTLICHYDDIPHLESKKDFGIWDDEYVCIVGYNADNLVTGITISKRKEDLLKAQQWQKDILNICMPVKSRTDIKRVQKIFCEKIHTLHSDRFKEFQHKSIELQMSVAAKECERSAVDSRSCRWYHSSWPILRALNVVSTPNWHGNFYTTAIAQYAKRQKGRLHILVSASADATILEHIEAALGDVSKAVIWLIDLCPTPLDIGRSYARLRKMTIHAVQMDVLCASAEGLPQNFFDIIITDAFITRFSSLVKKKQLMKEWSTALKQGGQLITTCRITGQEKEAGSQSDQQNFKIRTMKVFDEYSKRSPSLLKYITKDLVRLCVSNYSKHIVSYPLSEQALSDLCTKNNLVITNQSSSGSITKNNVAGEFKPTTYAQIVATKI